MNSPKLTNALLIALIAINGLFVIGWMTSAMHHRHENRIAMYYQFHGRHYHDGFSFHHRFEAFRGYHRERCCGGFRNYSDSRWN